MALTALKIVPASRPGDRPAARSGRFGVLARVVEGRALLLGERIDTRSLDSQGFESASFDRDVSVSGAPGSPLVLRAGDSGIAFVFRYGVAILFNVGAAEERELLDTLRAHTTNPIEVPESEQVRIVVEPDSDEQIGGDGTITLRDGSLERLQVVAHVLAKNVVLAHYEGRIASVFDQIDPLAERLHNRGRTGSNAKQLLRQIGYVLMTQHRMVGRVEIEEKPEVLWDYPALERLYARLADEYELGERSSAIERKLQLVQHTVGSLLELVQDARSVRLEYYVIALIVVEVLLSAYELVRHVIV